jgi:hypothetical protein
MHKSRQPIPEPTIHLKYHLVASQPNQHSQSRLPIHHLLPMLHLKSPIRIRPRRRPQYLLHTLHFLRVHPLRPQRHLVLLIVVNRRHLAHDTEEVRYCVTREVRACVARRRQLVLFAHGEEIGIGGGLTAGDQRNRTCCGAQGVYRWRHSRHGRRGWAARRRRRLPRRCLGSGRQPLRPLPC